MKLKGIIILAVAIFVLVLLIAIPVSTAKRTINLDFDGGVDGTPSVKVKYKNAMPSAVAPTRTGYSFQGYYDAKANGVQYYNATMQSVKNLDKNKNITLYAKWEANNYLIKFDANGGHVDFPEQQVTFGETYTLAPAERNGYIFEGWFKQNGKIFVRAQIWDIPNDIALLARWEKTSETVVAFNISNCKDKNGYNPNQQAGEADDKTRHDGFDVVQLVVNNAVKQENREYIIPQGNSLMLSLKIMQNLNSLNDKEKRIGDDGDGAFLEGPSGSISGPIRYGAYSIKVQYADGTRKYYNATNILFCRNSSGGFAPIEKGARIVMENIDASKKIKSITVEVCYEIMTKWSVLGFEEPSNWRCSTTLYFSQEK